LKLYRDKLPFDPRYSTGHTPNHRISSSEQFSIGELEKGQDVCSTEYCCENSFKVGLHAMPQALRSIPQLQSSQDLPSTPKYTASIFLP
jgi:hypothetical protein